MPVEIERKFLVVSNDWKNAVVDSKVCKQGYLVTDKNKTVRVRVMGDQGFLTVKGATSGFSTWSLNTKSICRMPNTC